MRKSLLLLLSLFLLLMVASCQYTPSPAPAEPTERPAGELSPLRECVRFESLTTGNTYKSSDTFSDAGADIAVMPFQWGGGTWTSAGPGMTVTEDGEAGGSGKEVFTNNVNLGFDIGDIDCVQLRFHDMGGNVNLIVNGIVDNRQDFEDTVIGGVRVSVMRDASGRNSGTLTLSGEFERFLFQEQWWISFAIGGQELAIDDVCPCESRGAADTESPCITDVIAPIEPEAIPPLEAFVTFTDLPEDFLLDHPLFEENFRAPGIYNEAEIPAALDIATIEVGPEGDAFLFAIATARDETSAGETLAELLQPGRHRATVGFYIDVDRNGASDYLAITSALSAERGIILPPTLDRIVGEFEIRVSDNAITMFLPREIIGDRFDWVAFTGYSPLEDAYFRTGLEELFFLPNVDVYYPYDLPANIGFSTSYSGTGVQCQVTKTGYNGTLSCPVGGNPTLVAVPGTSYQGVLLYRVQCDGRGYEFWCINQSFFGKKAFDGSQGGWVAKCPYLCGLNEESRWDVNADGLVDKIFHTITDQDCYKKQFEFEAALAFQTDLQQGDLAKIRSEFAAHGIQLTNDNSKLSVATIKPGWLWLVEDQSSNKRYVIIKRSQKLRVHVSLSHDHDGDTYLDVMEHTYLYPPTDQLTSCNKERSYELVSTVVASRCKPAQQPYSDPGQVPSNVP